MQNSEFGIQSESEAGRWGQGRYGMTEMKRFSDSFSG